MNKQDLIDAMATDAGISKGVAKVAIDSLLNNIKETLKGGGKVSLVGFGNFQTSERSARKGINPATKKAIDIEAKTVAKFVPGKELKEAVNS